MEGSGNSKLRLIVIEADFVSDKTITEILKLAASFPNGTAIVNGKSVDIAQLKESLKPSKSTATRTFDVGVNIPKLGDPHPASPAAPIAKPTPPPVAKPVAMHKPVNSAGLPITTHSNGRKKKMLICLERPGQTFTVKEAAALAGINFKTLQVRMSPGQLIKCPAPASGGFHFLPEGMAFPKPNYESRPRSSGQSTPISAHVVGRAARITHAERPTP